jgi:uncharacterized membrane protein
MSDVQSPIPWEIAFIRSWQKLASTVAAALAVASAIWELLYRPFLYDFIFAPDVIAPGSVAARDALFPYVAVAAVVSILLGVRALLQARRGRSGFLLHRELLCTALMVLPLLSVPAIEFEHPLFTALLVVAFSLALGLTVSRETATWRQLPELSRRQAQVLVGLAYATFVGVIGFIAYWRYITFHAAVADLSAEVNAVAGILRHGIPTISVGAYFYDGKPLPSPYFNLHVPLADYLFALFYAVYRQPSSIVWAQVVLMGSGTFGAYLIGHRWLESRAGGVLAAWLYVLTPSVQGFCLHDVHANVVAIPFIMLAVGLMEAGYAKSALAFAILTALCREETPIYAVGLGLYWLFSSEDRRRFRYGAVVIAVSVCIEVFVSSYLMPHFGGHPNWYHFNLFFDGTHSGAGLLEALLLNPLGALFFSTAQVKLDYFAITVVSLGGLALWGWRAGWFLVPAVLLLVPAWDPTFFSLGVNYSAPLIPAALLMTLAGLRRFWMAAPASPPNEKAAPLASRRVAVAAYALSCALLSNYLYGNIASKTYKLEYGISPLRRENQRNYLDIIGYVDTLPPYGTAEKLLWQVIDRVPKNVPILTSNLINPQLSHYDISFAAYFSNGNPPPEQRVKYIVLDKLPAFQTPSGSDVARLRLDKGWKVFYENASGVIFERR